MDLNGLFPSFPKPPPGDPPPEMTTATPHHTFPKTAFSGPPPGVRIGDDYSPSYVPTGMASRSRSRSPTRSRSRSLPQEAFRDNPQALGQFWKFLESVHYEVRCDVCQHLPRPQLQALLRHGGFRVGGTKGVFVERIAFHGQFNQPQA